MIKFSLSGSTSKTSNFLKKMQSQDLYSALDSLAQRGVAALSAATPTDTGLSAASWGYEIETQGDKTTITWTNSNLVNGTPVVIMLQYGHGTGTGGYVSGRDFINPAIQPIFDEIADGVWEEVTRA